MSQQRMQDAIYVALLKLIDALVFGALFFCVTAATSFVLSVVVGSWDQAIGGFNLRFHIIMSVAMTLLIWVALLCGLGERR